jgi:hypothetical protein
MNATERVLFIDMPESLPNDATSVQLRNPLSFVVDFLRADVRFQPARRR